MVLEMFQVSEWEEGILRKPDAVRGADKKCSTNSHESGGGASGTGAGEPLAKAAVAVGADGLLIEVHNDPEAAWCDGAQSLKPDRFAKLMGDLRGIANIVGYRRPDKPRRIPIYRNRPF